LGNEGNPKKTYLTKFFVDVGEEFTSKQIVCSFTRMVLDVVDFTYFLQRKIQAFAILKHIIRFHLLLFRTIKKRKLISAKLLFNKALHINILPRTARYLRVV
jgi:hypothetical protein